MLMVYPSSYTKPLPVVIFCDKGKPDLHPLISKLSEELIINFVLKLINTVYLWCTSQNSNTTQDSMLVIFAVSILMAVSFFHSIKYTSFEEKNQTGLSSLTTACDFLTSFPPEYMHSVLLGTFKKLLNFYVRGKKGFRFDCKMNSATLTARL